MWRLMAVSFACSVLSGCGGDDPTISPEKLQHIKNKARKEAETAARHIKYKEILIIAERSARKSAIEIAKQAVQAFSGQVAHQAAERIATATVNKAVQDMERQFADLSKSEIKAIRESALKTAGTTAQNTAHSTAEKTAEQIATASVNKAVQDMERQFADLSKSEIKAIRESALKTALTTAQNTAHSTAEQTAEQIATTAINKAVQDMERQLNDLSKSEIKAIRELALKTALTTAQNTAHSTAEQIATTSVNKAVQDMERQLDDLLTSEIKAIRESALKTALTTAQNTAHSTAEQTAEQIATTAINKAVQDMERQLGNLLTSEIKAIRELALETALTTAQNTAHSTAEHIATASVNKAVQDMERQLDDLLTSEIKAIRESALETALTTAQNTAHSTAEHIATASINKAVQDMEERFSGLLKAGLRTIISAAIEAATATAMEAANKTAVSEEATESAARQAAVAAAKEIAFDDAGLESSGSAERRYSFPFEECHWTNQEYTARIVQEHSFFLLSDPLEGLLEKWEEHQSDTETRADCDNPLQTQEDGFREAEICTAGADEPAEGGETQEPEEGNETQEPEEEFAYLSPIYEDFIRSFFQESIKDVELSENDVPLECFFAGAVRGAGIYNPGKDFYYCEKDSLRPGNMSVTDNSAQAKVIPPRRACLNRNYIYLTARAFNKTANCFGFDRAEKESIFNLFNHESSFLHNVKSPTGAKCYGQLTTGTIKEINKQIYFRDALSPLPYSHIFDEVIDKCPGLQTAVLNEKISESAESAGGKSKAKFNAIVSRSPISCKITQNPYSCLFYAFYNIKKNMIEIKKQFRKPTSGFGKKNNIPLEFKERFSLPISLNEMIGVTNTGGRDMIFWDDSELWGALRNRSPDSLSHIRKLPLFENEKEVMDLFSLWTYNGGISITLKYMTAFIRQLKRSIAVPCASDSKTKICRYRFAVGRGEGLATADIKKDFQDYIYPNYQKEKNSDKAAPLTEEEKERWERRRREVSNFVSNVARSLNYLHNENSAFKRHLKTLVPDLEDGEIESFHNHLREVCPKP